MSNKNNVIKLFPGAKNRHMTNPEPSRKERISFIQQATSAYLKSSYVFTLVG